MAMVFTDAKEVNHPLIFANDSFLSLSPAPLPIRHPKRPTR
jgi:hypothetical protein